MKYLKLYEDFNSSNDITAGIAREILPELEKIKSENNGIFTKAMLDNLMEERNLNSSMTLDVINYLENELKFEFTPYDDDSDDDSNESIVKSLIPEFEEMREDNGIFTLDMFEDFMKTEYGMDLKDIDEMISILATLHDDRFETEDGIEWKGFDSDVDDEDEDDVPPPPDGFEGYPGMEYSLN